MHWIPILLVLLLYMFRAAFLPIIRSSILLLVANGSSLLYKVCQSRGTAKNSWWWAERLPETCRVVIPIKLGFSASVDFIHKESVTMHGHTIVKIPKTNSQFFLTLCLWNVIPISIFRLKITVSDLTNAIHPVYFTISFSGPSLCDIDTLYRGNGRLYPYV
jgi:hypothetical protein